MANSKLLTQNDLKNVLAHINLGDDAHMEITQAEFDALTNEQKNDGTIYFVTDGASGNVFLDDNTPVGTIAPYGGSTDPSYWLICDGRAISRTDYAELFAIIGTTYGTGDGSTTFNIPDLRGKVPMGTTTGYAMGSTGGEAEHILQLSEMPAHTHGSKTLTGGFAAYRWGNGSTSGIMTVTNNTLNMDTIGSGTKIAHTSYSVNATHEHTSIGNGEAHNNLQPYTVTNYIIKYASTVSEHQANIDFYYPVGSYYETSNADFDPNVTWGGTWISEATVSNEIVIGTPTITGANSGVYCNLSRLGKTVRFQFGVNFNLNLAAGTTTTVGSIPLGFRPAAEVTVGGYILGGTYGFAYLEPSGEIKLQRVNAGTGNLIRQNFVYFTSDDISVGLRWHRTA